MTVVAISSYFIVNSARFKLSHPLVEGHAAELGLVSLVLRAYLELRVVLENSGAVVLLALGAQLRVQDEVAR